MININSFVKQLIIKDLFGKDSHRGVSLSYAWLANQLGHFTLGFLPSITLSTSYRNTSPLIFSKYVFLFWLIFEILNLFISLLHSKENRLFKPKWRNLIYDTFTDLLYFGLGTTFSLLLISPGILYIIPLNLAIIITLLYPFIDWYSMKMYQKYAFFPFQIRLSQWKGNFLDYKEINTIISYISNGKKTKTKGNHLLIYGSVQDEKTNLGIAMANELALAKQTCYYITATKLCSNLQETNKKSNELWNWNTSKFLVIDDVIPDTTKFTKPTDLFSYFNISPEMSDKNREVILNTNIIWVLGVHHPYQKEEWSSFLKSFGILSKNISVVNLSY